MQTTVKKPLSVIQSLAAGFELILQNPWVLLLPVALDLFVWLGPQISVRPLLTQFAAFVNSTAVVSANASAENLQNAELLREAIQAAADSFNVFGVIATGVPTLFWIQPPPAEWVRTILFSVSDVFRLFAILLPLGLIALALTTLYFELIGRAVRKESDAKTLVPRLARGFGTVTLLSIILMIAVVAVALPVSVGATFLSMINQNIASFLLLTGMLLVAWAMLYLAFILPSIFVSGANAWQAIFNSISIFRFDFWSAMGIVFLTYIIRVGFAFIWDFFGDNPWGILFDVIANAFLGSGLVAALMVFYADRIDWLNQLRERIRQHHAQLKGR